jgi:3-hydroxyisobutyrate dehydrogenase
MGTVESMTSTPTVALLGTGTMGAPMARNLAQAGIPVRVWNRTREKAESLSDVATVSEMVAEAVEDADVVITVLWDADTVAETMEQAKGHLAAGAIWLQQSTVGVEASDRLRDLAADLGVSYVDAPVLGTKKPAEDGALVVLASGPEEARDRARPVFDAIGSRTIAVGEAGAGTRLKLVVNSWIVDMLGALAETITLAQGLDISPELFFDAIGGGAMDAPYAHMKGGMMLKEEFPPSFPLDLALKDARLVVDAARDSGADPELAQAVVRLFERASELGHGDEDMAAIYYAAADKS